MFEIKLERTLQGWQRKRRSTDLQVGDAMLYSLYIADGQVVMAKDKGDLSYMVMELQGAYEERGVVIHKMNVNI
jgi:hypothetical protein